MTVELSHSHSDKVSLVQSRSAPMKFPCDDTWHQGHSLLRRKVKVELWTDDPGATSNEALQCAASSDTVTTVVNHTCWILMLADAAAAMGAKPLKPWTKCTGGLGPSLKPQLCLVHASETSIRARELVRFWGPHLWKMWSSFQSSEDWFQVHWSSARRRAIQGIVGNWNNLESQMMESDAFFLKKALGVLFGLHIMLS